MPLGNRAGHSQAWARQCAQVKNSLRAVNDRFEDADFEPPPVRVVVAEGDEDVTIKVRVLSVQGTEDAGLLCMHVQASL